MTPVVKDDDIVLIMVMIVIIASYRMYLTGTGDCDHCLQNLPDRYTGCQILQNFQINAFKNPRAIPLWYRTTCRKTQVSREYFLTQ
jgi:hypothetical protein